MLAKYLYLFFLSFIYAITTSAQPPPAPLIGISRDFTQQDDLISYSGIIKFNEWERLNVLDDKKLINLARLAYEEMKTNFRNSQLPNDPPAAMIAFAVPYGEVYFGSSIKEGRNIFMDDPSSPDDPLNRFDAIRKLLKACREGTRQNHNYNGKCGEPSVVDLYMSRHGYFLEDEGGPIKGRIVAWNGDKGVVMAPCDNGVSPERFGCFTFLTKELPLVRRILSGTPDSSDQDVVGRRFAIVERSWRTFTCAKLIVPDDGNST